MRATRHPWPSHHLLSLSWSPTFCEKHPRNEPCARHPGFVLHGLWPERLASPYPHDCATPQRIGDDARALGLTVVPTEQLMVHAWQKHGTCSGVSALDYFKAARAAFEGIAVPPALAAKTLVVDCAGPALTELRICLDRADLRPMPCGPRVLCRCGTGRVTVPGVR